MKQKRHTVILDLIKHNEIATQEELATSLRKLGYCVTQATVSRDIKELKLTKGPGASGLYCYVLPAAQADSSNRHMTILSRSVARVDSAQNIVVIKTHSGMAQAAAAVLDGLSLEEIVGTLAGDDTIFCVTHSNDSAIRLAERVRSLI